MKTPEEIKKAMEGCHSFEMCSLCPYFSLSATLGCKQRRNADALAYIQRLERERDALVEAIRDEGVVFFSNARMPCRYCDAEEKYTGERCRNCHNERFFGGFEWRGVKEE